MTEFKWISFCSVCKDMCCYDENIYASKSELQKLGVHKIENKEDGACIFLEDLKCSVYQDRPFECQIFPYDILEFEEKLFWVVWQNCPATPSLEHTIRIKYFEKEFPQKWDIIYIKNYVEHHRENEPEKYLDKTFIILREIKWE